MGPLPICRLGIFGEKLSLPITTHKQPYKLKWLNNDSKLHVLKQFWVSFPIGKNYQNKLIYDSILMHVCHLLFERHWVFGRRVMHDRYKNIYSFYKDKKYITLAPLIFTLCDKQSRQNKKAISKIFSWENHEL